MGAGPGWGRRRTVFNDLNQPQLMVSRDLSCGRTRQMSSLVTPLFQPFYSDEKKVRLEEI